MGKKKTARKKVPFSSNHIRGTLHTHGISGDVNLDHAIEVVSARSLHCKATFYFPFHTLSFGSNSLIPADIPGERK